MGKVLFLVRPFRHKPQRGGFQNRLFPKEKTAELKTNRFDREGLKAAAEKEAL